jgi:hypothetical protein
MARHNLRRVEDSEEPWGTGEMGEEPNAAGVGGISEGGIDALISAFNRWSGDDQLRRRAAERSRERWLRQQALDGITLSGILVDLAERGAKVALQTTNRLLRGRLIGTGQDLAVLEDQRCATIVNLAALVSVDTLGTPSSHGTPLLGHRTPVLPLRFTDALVTLAAEILPVRLHLPGEDVLGDLMAAGEDVVVLRLSSSSRRYRYVNLTRVEACSLC